MHQGHDDFVVIRRLLEIVEQTEIVVINGFKVFVFPLLGFFLRFQAVVSRLPCWDCTAPNQNRQSCLQGFVPKVFE